VYVVAFGVYAALLAVALLAPTSGTQSQMASWVVDLATALGIDADLATQARAEFLCNALILAPVSALGSLIWTSTTWKDWTAYTFVVATSVELAQGLLLPGRTASTVDIAANTLGGLLGALFVLVLRRLRSS
jgi:glycopeptide antibiotics resistance protein